MWTEPVDLEVTQAKFPKAIEQVLQELKDILRQVEQERWKEKGTRLVESLLEAVRS